MKTTEAETPPNGVPEGPPTPSPDGSPMDAPPPMGTGRRPRKRVVVVLVAVVGLAVAGLALAGGASFRVTLGAETIDSQRLATMSEQDLTEQGVPVEDVTCPEREIRQGDVFHCTARIDGQELQIEATQRDAEGTVDLQQLQAVLNMEMAERVGADVLGREIGTSLRLDCGTGAWLVKSPGDTFECAATTSDGERGTVVVTVEDVEGNVRFDVR